MPCAAHAQTVCQILMAGPDWQMLDTPIRFVMKLHKTVLGHDLNYVKISFRQKNIVSSVTKLSFREDVVYFTMAPVID